jgi:bifunctional non-homologous end joining protein LigD
MSSLSSRTRSAPAGFIEPCLPSAADKPPSGSVWIHEIKHDGYRLMARRDPVGIRLLTRRGNDWSARFPLVVEAVNHLKVRSCLIDGEVVCCDERGLARFDVLRRRRKEAQAFLYAFDLLGSERHRHAPRANRGSQGDLASILRKSRHGVRLNEHLEHDCGLTAFQHACRLGLEEIVSNRLGSRYRSRPFARLAQVQEPGSACGEAGGGRGLGEMITLTMRYMRATGAKLLRGSRARDAIQPAWVTSRCPCPSAVWENLGREECRRASSFCPRQDFLKDLIPSAGVGSRSQAGVH